MNNIQCMIKEYRHRKGLSQDELAQLVGIRRQAVYDMESGRYLPNTAVALRLAHVLSCTVEMLFVEKKSAPIGAFHLLNDARVGTRLSLAQVREKLVGVPQNKATMSLKLDASDGFLLADKTIDCLLPRIQLDKTILILGCDPALNILNGLLSRTAPGIRVHTSFASSRKALFLVNEGNAHAAGIHYHGSGSLDANIEAVHSLLPGIDCMVIAFSLQEEGLVVARGNPLNIHTIEDLINGKSRFVNREEGAALRKLLDTQLSQQGIPTCKVNGYTEEVHSHNGGAIRVASGTADVALGLRIVAESFGLDFVPLAVTRCDLVIPSDLQNHPGIMVLLNVLQSSAIKKEFDSLPGYDSSATGKIILG